VGAREVAAVAQRRPGLPAQGTSVRRSWTPRSGGAGGRGAPLCAHARAVRGAQVVDELFSYWTLEESEDTLEALEEALIVRPAPRPALTCPPALASPPRRAPLPRALTRAVSSGGGRSPACC
jgi:hypothetical protein